MKTRYPLVGDNAIKPLVCIVVTLETVFDTFSHIKKNINIDFLS